MGLTNASTMITAKEVVVISVEDYATSANVGLHIIVHGKEKHQHIIGLCITMGVMTHYNIHSCNHMVTVGSTIDLKKMSHGGHGQNALDEQAITSIRFMTWMISYLLKLPMSHFYFHILCVNPFCV